MLIQQAAAEGAMLRLSKGRVAMKTNVGGVDKWLRIAVGLLLIVWAATRGPVWAWIGVVPLATGLFNFCPLYALLGFNTCKR
ncbi:YgaP family membrane protein [Thermomonas fusca]|jgi:hypothetical protein